MKESVRLAVQQATACSPSKVFILWDEQFLTLVNFPKKFQKELTFVTKAIEVDNRGRRKSVRKNEECFIAEKISGVNVLYTHQGFWRRALNWAVRNQHPMEVMDLRTSDLLPLPQMGMMKGFRFSQRELVVQALSANCSGLIEAPTRWGKSTCIKNIFRAWSPKPGLRPKFQSLLLVPGADLIRQSYEDLKADMPDREIKMIGGGSTVKFQSEDITVVSADSMHRIDPGPVRLVVIDEPHAIISPSRVGPLSKFSYARKLALGATLTGRFDGRDFLLEGLVGPVIARRTYTEAVAEGAICPLKVMMIRWPVDAISGDRDLAYRALLFENELIGRCARYLSDVVIPREWQMLYFIKTEDQADFLSDCIGRDVSVAMAKKLTNKERKEMTENVRRNNIKRVICSDIYVQGVTFHEVMVLVNCGGGGASTTTIQKPGRLAEIRPGKNAGLMVDFLFEMKGGAGVQVPEGVAALMRESRQRLSAYRDIGYDVHVVERNEIQPWFDSQNITAPT